MHIVVQILCRVSHRFREHGGPSKSGDGDGLESIHGRSTEGCFQEKGNILLIFVPYCEGWAN